MTFSGILIGVSSIRHECFYLELELTTQSMAIHRHTSDTSRDGSGARDRFRLQCCVVTVLF